MTDKFVMGTRDADRPNGDDLSDAHQPSAVFACGSCREWAVWRRQPAKLSVGSYRVVAGTQLGVLHAGHGTVVGYIPTVQVAEDRHFGWAASRSQLAGMLPRFGSPHRLPAVAARKMSLCSTIMEH